MSTDYNMYYGAVIIAQNKMTDDKVETLGCPKCKTKNAKDRFCPECGTQIGLIPSQKQIRAINVWDFTDKCNEDLRHIDQNSYYNKGIRNLIDYYIPNKINIGASCILLDPIHDDIDTDLTNLDPQEGIEEFKKAYGEQIQLVENEYGKENVKIEWRLFNWAN